jgi:formate C-acetyltransferase
MGEDNGNTTNSWLNLAKILELTLNGGVSALSGRKIGLSYRELGVDSPLEALKNIREIFYKHADFFLDRMVSAANGASRALSHLRVPFLSAFMGGVRSGADLRDTAEQGTKYNGSGCLIHGLSVAADAFTAIDAFMKDRPQDADRLIAAFASNFREEGELKTYLLSRPKFGNNTEPADTEAALVCRTVSDMVRARKNYLGNPFRADWSSPSTHLLYGYYVGATPDGRSAREMLGYGADPLYGEARAGLGFRTLSSMKLPYECMNGGYASHFGIDPNYFTEGSLEEKGIQFKNRVIAPLFFNGANQKLSPFYLYVNVTTPDILRKVLAEPKKYAPSGVYIMRIHGTFVNFLDLSPAIQEDIMKRLDLKSTIM